MKKIIGILLILAVTLSLAACSGQSAERPLYDHGLDLIALMEEMAESKEYFPLYTANPEMQEIVSVVSKGDYSQPKAVYQITIAEDMISAVAELDTTGNLSESLRNCISARTYAALASQINAVGGAEVLAAASICTAGKTFVNTELSGSTLYLYTYENGVPAIVSFTSGEDHTVAASSSFLFNPDFKTDTLEAIQQYFADYYASVHVVER